jgi:fructokinase
MENTNNFLSFGEILWDIIDGKPYIGGAPFNVAAHLANCGANSYMLSRLGKDDLGKQALGEIGKLKVSTSLIQWDDAYPTGTVEVFIDKGQPDYFISENVAYDYISIGAMPPGADLLNFDCLYFGTLAQRNLVSRETLRWVLNHLKFKTVFYDVNLRKGVISKELIVESLRFCTIFKLNNEEVDVISNLLFDKSLSPGDFATNINKEFNIEVIIITAAERGCYLYYNRLLTFIAGEKVALIDGVGAGDAFSAAFLLYFVQYKNALRSAEIANKLGAFVASCRGPIPSYSEEIRTHLNNARLQKL